LIFFLRFYLFIRERARTSRGGAAGRGRGRRKLPAEPGARYEKGLDPEPKADA